MKEHDECEHDHDFTKKEIKKVKSKITNNWKID